MRYLAYLAIATFFTISALVSTHKERFSFIYGIPGKDQLTHFIGMGLLAFFKGCGHIIEGPGQFANLVASFGGEPGVPASLGEFLGGVV